MAHRRNSEGVMCEVVKYTHPCSGCSCDCSDGYGCDHGNSGCHECGYQGKRRVVMYIPLTQFIGDHDE